MNSSRWLAVLLLWCGFLGPAALLQNAPAQDDEAQARRQSMNNLKELALAMHNYHDKNKTFPPAAISDQAGKPLLSWRVAILPYLNLKDNPHKEFKLNEAWDSEHNKKALAKMPPVFGAPGKKAKEPSLTYYQVFTGPETIFTGTKGLRMTQITDGTSYTLLIAEGGEAVPWAKPEDLQYDAKKPLPKLGGLFKGGFHAAFADGSVRFFDRKIPEATIRALITRAGGEVVTLP